MIKKATTLGLVIAMVILGTGLLYGQTTCLYVSDQDGSPPETSTHLTDKMENDWGFEVQYLSIANWGLVPPEDYDFIVVDEIISSGDLGNIGTDWPKPLLNMEGWGSDVLGITAPDEELEQKNIPTQDIVIADESHPVAADFSGNVSLLGTQGGHYMIHFGISLTAEDVIGIASAADDGEWVVAAVDSGGTLVPAEDGTPRTAPHRMATIGIHNDGIAGITDDGFTILKATIDWLLASGSSTAIEGDVSGPTGYRLSQNYPNPFNPTTQISFTIQQQSLTTLTVYNSRGQVVETLLDNQSMAPGTHQVSFNGAGLPTGVYFYGLTAGTFSDMRKMVLMK